MEYKEKFAQRLIYLREQKRISQQELADNLEITRQSLSLYEKAERTINIELLAKIADFFHVSTDYLMGRTDTSTMDEDIKTACNITGLSEGAVHNLHYINFEDEFDFGNNKEVLNLLIETLDNYLLYNIRLFFSIRDKKDLLNRIILTKYCKDNNLDFTDREIYERGEYIFKKNYDMLISYRKYESEIKFEISKYPFDLDLNEDLDYLKFKLVKELEKWIFDDLDGTLYVNGKKIDDKYSNFYSEAISCILQETEYKNFLHNLKYVDLSLGVAHEILKEKRERDPNAEHNPTSE